MGVFVCWSLNLKVGAEQPLALQQGTKRILIRAEYLFSLYNQENRRESESYSSGNHSRLVCERENIQIILEYSTSIYPEILGWEHIFYQRVFNLVKAIVVITAVIGPQG